MSFLRSITFKGANENITTLCTKAERKQKDRYVVFQKSLEQYVTTTFTNPGDILPVVRDLIDSMMELMKDIPRLDTIDTYFSDASVTSPLGGNVETSSPQMTREESDLQESLNSLCKEEIKVFAARKKILRQNQIKLWGVIWGHYSPALQIEVKGDDEYNGAQTKYSTV